MTNVITQGTTPAIIPFNFEGAEVRVNDRNGDLWWVLSDVCSVLEIANSRDAGSRLEDDEKDDVGITDAIGREQITTVINESGLWSLVLTSRKPAAKRFKKWITSEVIPSIRKTGSYSISQATKPKRIRKTPIDTRFIQLKRIALASGKDEGQAVICANTGVLNETGYNALEMMGIKALSIEGDEHYYTPTDIGAEFGMSGREVNQILKRAGLQIENPAKSSTASNWLPTEMGKRYGRMQDGVRSNGKGSTQTLMWKKDTASFLRPFAKTPARAA